MRTMAYKRSNAKVFIGFIPANITEERLRRELTKYGKLATMFYMPDISHQSKGWAFVTFDDKACGMRAIEAIDGKAYFEGSEDLCKAFFVSSKKQPDYMRETRSAYTGPIMLPGYWQQFTTSEGVVYYYNCKTGQSQWERPPEAGYEEPEYKPAAPAAGFGPPGANLFVFHLPSDWDDVDLIRHFKSFGSVISARVQKDSSGRNRGFGFISYDNPLSAISAIKHMNGFSVSGKYLKVQLKKGEERYVPLNSSSSNGMDSEFDTGSDYNGTIGNTRLSGVGRNSLSTSLSTSWRLDSWESSRILSQQDGNSSTTYTEYQSPYLVKGSPTSHVTPRETYTRRDLNRGI